MIHDFVHMTQGELLIKYWWLWLGILAAAITVQVYLEKKRRP